MTTVQSRRVKMEEYSLGEYLLMEILLVSLLMSSSLSGSTKKEKYSLVLGTQSSIALRMALLLST